MKGTYIFLADGYEPLEALAPMDVLKRAKIDCKFVSTGDSLLIPSTQDYAVEADLTWDEFKAQVDLSGNDGCMIFPGGLPGADNLGGNRELMQMMNEHFDNGGLTCAICAAPARVLAVNLGKKLQGRRMTSYDGFDGDIVNAGATYTASDVQTDGNLITAKGPGLAIDFGLAILEKMVDPRIYDVVKHAMML